MADSVEGFGAARSEAPAGDTPPASELMGLVQGGGEESGKKEQELTGLQKAAALVVLMGDEHASQIYRLLEDREIQSLSGAISQLGPISPQTALEVMEEFYHMILARDYMARGGSNYAKRLLLKSVGPDRCRKIITRLTREDEGEVLFANAQSTHPRQLARLIAGEHPQTVALVLAHLSPENSAEVMANLPEGLQTEIAVRLANLGEIYPDVVREVSRMIDERLQHLNQRSTGQYGGVRTVAECLNRMEREQSREILDQIEDQDPNLAVAIRNLMVVFDDLLLIDDRQMMEVLKRIDRSVLAAALKGTSPELKEKFFRNMSSRAATIIQQEMEFMGPVKLKDVERAQHEIVTVVRQMEEEGLIDFGRGGDNELVV